MPESAEYQALLALKTSLEGITTANGYETDVRYVLLHEEAAQSVPGFPAIELTNLGSTNDQSQWSNKNGVTMDVRLVLMLEQAGTGSEAAVGRFIADVFKRLMGDEPQFFGTTTTVARIGRVERIHSAEEHALSGAVMQVQLFFLHSMSDPFTLVT